MAAARRATCQARAMLRLLRGRRDGRSTLRARVVAAVVVVGLLAFSAPILAVPTMWLIRWLLAVL